MFCSAGTGLCCGCESHEFTFPSPLLPKDCAFCRCRQKGESMRSRMCDHAPGAQGWIPIAPPTWCISFPVIRLCAISIQAVPDDPRSASCSVSLPYRSRSPSCKMPCRVIPPVLPNHKSPYAFCTQSHSSANPGASSCTPTRAFLE